MFLGFSEQVWVILGVEFAERLGYYAVSFSLYTYFIHLLLTGSEVANKIINGIYIIIPLCACIASGLADGPLGRTNVLASSLILYAAGLTLLTISSLPLMFSDFPNGPTTVNYTLLGISLLFFAAGYGAMKVCTNPIMADSVTLLHQQRSTDSSNRAEEGVETKVVQLASVEDDGQEMADSPRELSLDFSLQRLFRVVYWVSNFGAILGICVAPLLRNLDTRKVKGEGSEYTSGYYYSYGLATVSVLVGAVLFFRNYRLFPRNPKAPPFVFFRLFGRALWYRFLFLIGRIKDHDFQNTNDNGILGYALYGKTEPLGEEAGLEPSTYRTAEFSHPPTTEEREEDTTNIYTVSNLEDSRLTLKVCVAFLALPLYWLIANQFSTNIMFLIEALDLPSWVPPELFNSINTFTTLIFLAVYEHLQTRYSFRGLSPHMSIVVGFVLMSITMLWCGIAQMRAANRGYYNKNDEYVLHEGRSKLSSMSIVFPYIIQGIAAGLVDPSVMEIAYVGAPARMKGTVMGLYWMASSCSGFLGVIFSPIMRPSNGTALFFTFSVLQLCVTGVFYYCNRRTN